MKKRMTMGVWRIRWTAIAISVWLAVAADMLSPVYAASPAPRPAAGNWRPPGCPPPATPGNGPSSLKVTGPCAFEHKGEAECEAEFDDLLITVVRKAKNAAELMLYINVERYVGAGNYKAPNDMFVSLKDGAKIYRWYSNDFEVTVGPQSKYVTVRDVRLEPELVLVGCTGPQTNYQCDGRSENEPKHMETITTVSGTIYCRPGQVKR